MASVAAALAGGSEDAAPSAAAAGPVAGEPSSTVAAAASVDVSAMQSLPPLSAVGNSSTAAAAGVSSPTDVTLSDAPRWAPTRGALKSTPWVLVGRVLTVYEAARSMTSNFPLPILPLFLLRLLLLLHVPCQTYAHLPRRFRFSLPNRPLTSNRVVAMDDFQIAPDLPKVLDISCVDTDYGQGRFVPSMHGPVIFAILYIAWLSIWGSMETITFDRGTENENDAVINGITSMGIHWRAAPTEAPWGIGRNERHRGPIRAAFLKIRMETPDIAPDMALAMAYKARNDAPRAHGVSPTTVVTGEPPRLLIGDNAHADPAVAARARAMQTARATMESYTAADRLRNALAHRGTNVAYVEVGQSVLFHRRQHGWLCGTVHSLDGKTVYVRRNDTLFSSHESRTKPYVTRARQPQDAHRVSASTRPQAPIRTHTPAPPEATTLPPAARAYAVHYADINSPAHPRWDAAKRTEIATFDAMDCKKAIHASDVPAGKQIFNYIWRVTGKANRGNGKPDERARFCLAGNQDWHKETIVATSPVTPQRSIRAIVAASVVLDLKLHTEDFLRAYLQSDQQKEPIYVRASPEAGLPDGYVWAFYRSLYGKDDAGRHFHFSVQCRFLTIPRPPQCRVGHSLHLASARRPVYLRRRHIDGGGRLLHQGHQDHYVAIQDASPRPRHDPVRRYHVPDKPGRPGRRRVRRGRLQRHPAPN